MARGWKIALIALSICLFVVAGGLYLASCFFRAFAPAKVTITENDIRSRDGFVNGITIEKIRVDSMGNEPYPGKYTVVYATHCSIDHPENKPPDPPKKIRFHEKGKYWWMQENLNIQYLQYHMGRSTTDSSRPPWAGFGPEEFETCPITLEKEQWYFFTVSDPQTIGIFFYIDKEGKGHQYPIYSGVSPI